MSKPLNVAGVLLAALAGVAVITAISGAPLVFFRAYRVSSASMADTLAVGDRILIRQYPRPKPEFGDIVVIVSPMDHKEAFIKRVVGLPGDHIRLVNRVLFRNGRQQPEPYAKFATGQPDALLDNFPGEPSNYSFPGGRYMLAHDVADGELIVPPKTYFVMGDNREDSLDDRLTGVTPEKDIIGKALFLYMGSGAHGGRWFRPL